MKRCLQCNRSYRNSNTFCSDDGTPLVESESQPKTFNITVIVLAAVAFGIAFGVTIWSLQPKSAVSQARNEPTSANNVSPASSSPSPEKMEVANSTVQTIPQPAPKSEIDVQVEYFTSSKVNDHPMPNEPVILQAGGKSFSGVTNSKGFARFNNVPCGKQVKITFTGEPSRTFNRNLACEGQTSKWRYYFNAYKEFNSSAIEQVK